MTSAFTMDLEGFKQEAKKFIDRTNNEDLSDEAIAGAKKSLAISYLNMVGDDREVDEAAIILKLALRNLREKRPCVV